MQRQVRLVALVLAVAGGVAYADPAPSSVEGTGWTVRASVAGNALFVALTARGAFHLNDEYPIHFDVTADPHVDYKLKRVEHKDVQLAACKDPAHKCAATVSVPFQATVGGHPGGTLAFAACDADRCVIEKIAVSASAASGK